MPTKLQSLLGHRTRPVETQDIQAAFLRILRDRWGYRGPLPDVHVSRSVVRVVCLSPLWRVELLYNLQDLTDALRTAVPGAQISRIAVDLV